MTPILRNRHEKVQEASINLIGRIGKHLEALGFLNCRHIVNSGSWCRIRTCSRVDAHLFRVARPLEGA